MRPIPAEVVPLRESAEPPPEPKPKTPKLRGVEVPADRDDAPVRKPKPARSSRSTAIFAACAALFAFAAFVLGLLSYLKPAPTSAPALADYSQKLDALDRKVDGQTAAMFEILARWKAGGFSFQASAPKVRTRTLLLVSHDLRTARAQADRFLLLRPDCGPAESFAGGDWHRHAADLRTQLGWVEPERDGGR